MTTVTAGISADTTSYRTLLGGEFLYRVPIFQRPYVWQKSKVTRLFDDILDVDGSTSDEGHFLGSMFVSKKSEATPMSPGEYWVIDGQQRTTTIYLSLLGLLSEICKEIARTRPDKDKKLSEEAEATFNALCALRNSVSKHLFVKLDQGGIVPKLHTTLKDSRQMRALLSECGVDEIILPPAKGDEGETAITEAYKVTRRRVKDQIYDGGKLSHEKAGLLLNRFLQNTKIVLITITEKEDAGVVFNTLNSTAEPLSTLDLVRNAVFGRVGGGDPDFSKAQSLYDAHWEPLELRFNDKDHFDAFLFPYALAIRPTSKKKRLMPNLAQIWTKKNPEGTVTEFDGRQIIEDLSRHAGAYLALSSNSFAEMRKFAENLHPELATAMWRLRRMEVSSVIYPYIFRLLDECRAGDDMMKQVKATECLSVIEAFLVRRFFRGFEPTGLHAVFKGMWDEAGSSPSALLGSLRSVKTIEFPDDASFVQAVQTHSIYQSSLGRYVVMEYERKWGGSGQDKISEYLEEEEGGQVTLDHISPQSGAVPGELVHTWANLIPVSQSTNSSKGGMAWGDARKLLKSSARFKSALEVADNFEEWGPPQIKQRAEALSAWALTRWKV